MHKETSQRGTSSPWRHERSPLNSGLAPSEQEISGFDPATWTCAVCGKVRLRELLHSKAILGRQELVCAPSCLGAERRANAR